MLTFLLLFLCTSVFSSLFDLVISAEIIWASAMPLSFLYVSRFAPHWVCWRHNSRLVCCHAMHCKKKQKTAKADFCIFSTYFLGNFSTFCCINLKQEVEKTQKSEAGCLKILSLPNFFFFYSVELKSPSGIYQYLCECLYARSFIHRYLGSTLSPFPSLMCSFTVNAMLGVLFMLNLGGNQYKVSDRFFSN